MALLGGGVVLREAGAEERAYSEILQAIVTQKYVPGDHLVEAKVAEELNMSLTPVRGALKRMIACGILEYIKNVGYRIPVLTPYDMVSVFQVRTVLESKSASLATMRVTNIEVERLYKLLDQEKELYVRGETAAYTKVNELLHLGNCR